jgi:F-type H+-transporting ATPase subunit delta
MSQAITLARPYARAAFALASAEGGAAAWSQALGFSATATADAGVRARLGHPGVPADTLVELLLPPGNPDDRYRRFLALLAANRRLVLLPEILAIFELLRAEQDKVVRATVTSAAEMAPGELETLRAALARRFGREVVVTTAVDPALLGGAVIDAGDVVIDGSVRGKLARLASSMSH